MLHRGMGNKKAAEKPLPKLTDMRWKALIYQNWSELVDELSESLAALYEKSEALGVVPECLHIHYLRTSVYNKLPFFRLDFFDEKKWNGNTECWVYWDAGVVTDMLYTCMPYRVDKYAPTREKKEDAVLEKKRLECANVLHGVMGQMIEALLQDAVRKSDQEIGCAVYYGEYMGGTKGILR